MSDHIAQAVLERYVIGALDEVSVARVDAHVAECDACMRALGHEAALEMAFESVAQAKVVAISRARSARAVAFACAVGGAVSLAAAWMLWVVPGDHAPGASVETSIVDDDASGTTASLDSHWRDRVLDGG
jgi:hypothetical protein